ncbi:hypothetical protein [Sagittula sp. SSi028]
MTKVLVLTAALPQNSFIDLQRGGSIRISPTDRDILSKVARFLPMCVGGQ